MASMSEAAAASQRDTDIVVPQVFVEGNYLGVSEGGKKDLWRFIIEGGGG